MIDRENLIDGLRGHIEDVLRACIPPSTRHVALVGFPNHANVGDSAIWLGQTAYCSDRDLRVVDVCDRRTYSKARLRRRLKPNAVILLTGGGNFGDLFRGDQSLREQVIGDFPDYVIVQLPQTIHFESAAAIERTRRVVDSHPRLTLLLRDTQSIAFAEKHFSVPKALCPDMAFWLGALRRPVQPSVKQLWLWRTDVEAPPGAGDLYKDIEAGTRVSDWVETEARLQWWNKRITRLVVRHPESAWLKAVAVRFFSRLAEARFQGGCRLLAEGQVVVTNRLHAHILCVLMGIPHIVLDNSYGKVSRFAHTWKTVAGPVMFCNSIAEARAAATKLTPTND